MAHPLVETPLSCFFNFSGPGSGLFIPPIPWPFQSACQILLWFRVQEFTSSTSNSLNGDGNSSSSCTNSSIASFTTGEGIGIEYILEDNSLCMLTTIPGTKSAGVISRKTVISGDLPTLEINKWYSLVLQVIPPPPPITLHHRSLDFHLLVTQICVMSNVLLIYLKIFELKQMGSLLFLSISTAVLENFTLLPNPQIRSGIWLDDLLC